MISTEWPTKDRPNAVPFLVRDVSLLRKHNVIVDVFHFRGGKNPFNYFKATIKLSKKLRRSNYNLIHAQWGQSAIPVFFSNLPLVTTFRGSDLFGITNKDGRHTVVGNILKFVSRMVAIRSNYVVLVSNGMLPLISKKKKIAVLPSGINLSLFSPSSKEEARKRLSVDPAIKIVFFGGDRNRPDKRFFLAEDAIKILESTLPVQLLVANDVDQDKMPEYYRAADVLLLTSKHEGSPNMVKEALACNLPVVSVDVGDVKERISGLPNCYICENDRPEVIANTIKLTLESKKEAYSYRKHVLDLDEHLLIQKQIDIYKTVLGKV
ncbi:MAG: glycosyltransferase [Cyclobacteriaceae bacterium]